MPSNDESNPLHLISDILDKLIDTQQANAEASTALKAAVRESNEILDDIRVHFTNGFRSEIKNHVTEELDDHFKKNFDQQESVSKSLQEINTKLDKVVETLTRPWFWIKLVGTIVVSLGVIIAAVSQILQYVS